MSSPSENATDLHSLVRDLAGAVGGLTDRVTRLEERLTQVEKLVAYHDDWLQQSCCPPPAPAVTQSHTDTPDAPAG